MSQDVKLIQTKMCAYLCVVELSVSTSETFLKHFVLVKFNRSRLEIFFRVCQSWYGAIHLVCTYVQT